MITYDNTKTMYDLLALSGKDYAKQIFLSYEKDDDVYDITFGEFTREAMAVAAWAEAKKKEYGHTLHIALMGTSSHYYLITLLGIMASGNVAIPLDTQLDGLGFSDNLNRADVDICFYDWEFIEIVERAQDRCENVKEFISLQSRSRVATLHNIRKEYRGVEYVSSVEEKDLAMILFTSGTTGKGKGVMLSHQNLIDNVFCTTEPDYADEVYLNVLPMHHVFCLNGDVFLTMRYGSKLCLNMDMTKLLPHIQLFQPTAIRMVPMMARSLYNRIVVMEKQSDTLTLVDAKEEVLGKNLYKIISGGGYLAPELAADYNEIGIGIMQGYGMSECSPKIAAPDWSRPDTVSTVGKVVDRCEVRIVDNEIQVKSPSVMMGYYKDPEETANSISEDGWLMTGDLGYVDEENFLHFTGRKKNLIILSNGENVAPEELENLFVDENLIEDILAYEADDMLKVAIYPNYRLVETLQIEDVQAAMEEIVAKKNESLPSYKRILGVFVKEQPFEKTSSKKIIRSKFFEEKKDYLDRNQATYRMPENDVQQTIYDSIAASLGHRNFGIDQNFYELGLDSMGSVMVLTDLFNKLEISITLGELAEHATVLKLEAFSKTAVKSDVDYTVRPIYPLTNLQLYFAYVLRGNTTANLPFLFKLDPSIDLERLQKAAIDVFDIHPELKCVIQMFEDKGLANFRDDSREVNIPIVEMSDAEWENTKDNLVIPFMYNEGDPLYHSAIYKTPSCNYFFFDLAHIMGDGMSVNVIFDDMNKLYSGEKVEKQNYTYYEFILDEKDRDEKGIRQKNIEYFKELATDYKVKKSILTKKGTTDLSKGINGVLKNYLEDTQVHKVKAYCKKHGVSENAMFLTAFNYTVSVFSGENTTITSSIHSGRTDSRWNRITGPLFLTYMFRYSFRKHERVPSLLKRNAKQILETMDCYISNLRIDEMFIQYQGDILNINEMGGLPMERQRMQLDALPFHLQIFVDKKGYYYELRYWENRFDRELLEIFMQCYEIILNAMFTEVSVRRLRKHIPHNLSPKHYAVDVATLNAEAGETIVASGEDSVKVYILDQYGRKLPFGGWGTMYVKDVKPTTVVDQIENPYGDGELYATNRIARIMPDGQIDFLANSGRTIIMESITGRVFINLYELEQFLNSMEGISNAECYVMFGDANAPVLAAEVDCVGELDTEKVSAAITEKFGKGYVPSVMNKRYKIY